MALPTSRMYFAKYTKENGGLRGEVAVTLHRRCDRLLGNPFTAGTLVILLTSGTAHLLQGTIFYTISCCRERF